jgi:hypothetical protein
MFTLHCTAKLRDRLKRPLSDVRSPTTTRLGDWYATALFWKPQLALLVNERTLLPVLMPLAPAATLPQRVAAAVSQVLQLHGIDQDFIVREVAAMADVEVAKTRNRSVVGTMNEFAFEAEVYRDHRGMIDPLQLAMRLAETPCGAIKYESPARLLRDIRIDLAKPLKNRRKQPVGRRMNESDGEKPELAAMQSTTLPCPGKARTIIQRSRRSTRTYEVKGCGCLAPAASG